MAATVISTGGVSAAVSYKKAEAAVSYIDIAVQAELTFPDRFLVEIVAPTDAATKSFSKLNRDTALLSEAAAKGFAKARADSVTMTDDADIDFVLGKILRDVQSLSDAKVVSLAKALVDLAVASDAKAITLSKALADSGLTLADIARVTPTKGLSDAVTISESVTAVRLFIRAFVETLVTTETKRLSINKAPFNHSVGASDADTYSFTKVASESVVMIDNMDGDITYQVVKVIGELISTPTDRMVRGAGLAKSESLTISTSGVAFMTDYADISYFAEDFVGVSSTFS